MAKKTHTHHKDHKPSEIPLKSPQQLSIFNHIEIKMPEVKQQNIAKDESKQEDGCTSCFKAIFECLKR